MQTKSWKKWAIWIVGILFAVFTVVGVKTFTTSAEEEFMPDVTVKSAKELKEAVLNDAQTGTNYKIRLGADVVLGTEDDQVDSEIWGLRTGTNKDITLDLNGHTMKRQGGGFVINNQIGSKLELIDTSAGKTGLIMNDEANDVLIYNWGTLTINVNMTNPTRYYGEGRSSYNSFPMVQSSASPTEKDYTDASYTTKWTAKPIVTVKGGNFKGGRSNEFFKMIDSDLVIEDGTFTRDEDDVNGRSIFTANTYTWSFRDDGINSEGLWFSDVNKPTLRQQINGLKGELLQAYAPYRGCNVEIKGGDFTGTHGKPELITLNNTVNCNIKCGDSDYYADLDMDTPIDAHKVSISGGTWATDYTTYCAAGKWMEPADDGEYYNVHDIDPDLVAATVTADGDVQKSFSNYDAAWLYATRNLSGERKITVQQDADIEQMNLWYGNDDTDGLPGAVTLDLNGHKLTYSDKDPGVNGSHAMIALGNDKNLGDGKEFTLTVKDGSEEQSGELIIKIETESPSYEHGIHISNKYARFVFESGTIRQVGYFPDENVYTDPGSGNGSQNKAEAIFNIGESLNNVEDAIVTIKGGNILSEIYFGTEESHGDLTASPILIAWDDGYASEGYKNVNFQVRENDTYGYSFPDKKDRFVFDLEEFIVTEQKTSVFSWDLKGNGEYWGDISDQFGEFTYVTMGANRFAFTHLEEDENFLAGGKRYKELSEAIAAAKSADGVVSFLRNFTLGEALELENVTLDLDFYLGCSFTIGEEGSLTLKDGAAIHNGTVTGDIAIDGDATLQNVTVTGDVTVNSGTLTITSGTYQGTFTFEEGADAVISGGTFKGKEIKGTLDQYFTAAHGAYITAGQDYEDASEYEVKIAPNIAAQTWYKTNVGKAAFEIATTDEWNYFAIYVSSGVDDFNGKTVKLTENLNFGYVPPVNGVSAMSEPLTFFPAGNQTYRFKGTFDGNEKTMSGICVTEINAGVFGGTNGPAKINNLTVSDSVFIGGSGVGYFDELNTEKGWVFVGGVVAQGNLGHTTEENAATGIKVNNVTISQKKPGTIMGGGFIGQTWSTLYLKGIEVDNVTLDGSWKMGGIVGFTEASVFIIDGSVKNVESARDCTYFGSVMGQLVGQSLTLDGCAVDASDSYLVGGMDAGSEKKDVNIKGTGTDIAAKGTAGLTGSLHGSHEVELKVTVPTTDEESQAHNGFTLDFKEEEIPNDAYVFEGDQVVVLGAGEDDNEVTKAVSSLGEDDVGKVIAGAFAEAIDEKYIAPGYAYIKKETKYVVCEMAEYYPLLLSGPSEEGAEMSLAEYRDHLLNTYEYSEEAIGKIEAIYTRIEKELGEKASELTMTEVRKLINSAKAEMDAVPILSAEKAQKEAELEQAKKDAGIDLKLYAASNGVSLSDKSVTDGLKAIGEAETTADVATELDAAKKAVDAAKKATDDAAKEEADKQAAAAALTEAKKDAKNDLQLYAASNGVALSDKSVTDGLKAIDEATSEQTVASALTTAKGKVDAAKKAADDAAKAADEAAKAEAEKQAAAAALAEAKKNAKNDLQLYAASNGVALSDKSVTGGLAAIGEAETAEEVAAALDTAQEAVDAAKKAADDAAKAEAEKQAAAAALAEAKKNAKNDLQLYAASNGVALSDKSVTDGLKAIDDAADEQKASEALTAAKTDVDEAKKAADDAAKATDEAAKAEAEKQAAAAALAEAKKNAKNDLQLYAASNGVALSDKSVTDGLKAIDDAADEQKASEALTAAKTDVDEAKKAADDAAKAADEAAKAEAEKQSAAAALAEAKRNAETELKLHAASKGVPLDDEAVKDGLFKIESASDESGVSTALTTAAKNVDAAADATQSSGPSGWEIAFITISAVEIFVIAALIVVCVIKKKKKS